MEVKIAFTLRHSGQLILEVPNTISDEDLRGLIKEEVQECIDGQIFVADKVEWTSDPNACFV